MLLRKIAQADLRVVQAARAWLASDDHRLRYEAASLLCELDRVDQPVVDALRSVLTSGDLYRCLFAATRLHQTGHADQRVVESLRSLLGSEKSYLQWQSLRLLHTLGHADEPAIRAVELSLHKCDPWGLMDASLLLCEMGRTPQVVAALLHILQPANEQAVSGAFHKAARREPLTPAEVQLLADLFSTPPTPPRVIDPQPPARNVLFTILCSAPASP